MELTTRTVGFADLTYFDKISGFMGPERVLRLLDDAYRAAGDAIVTEGGIIHKYIGDAILFSFEDPSAAIRAADKMVESFYRELYGYRMDFNVSLATGLVALCRLGHPYLRQNDIIGEAVNRAAKLLRKAGREPDGIALCPVTAKYR